MENNENKSDKKEVAVMKPLYFGNMSFEEAFNLDDKDLQRQISHKEKKEGKRLQLIAKINDTKLKVTNIETKFAKSITDPTIDSVELMVKMKVYKEEMKLAVALHNQIFPEAKLEMQID